MQYYQLATKEQFDKYNVDLSTSRQITDGRYIRHLEFSNVHMKEMWSDPSMKPITKEEIESILEQEPIKILEG